MAMIGRSSMILDRRVRRKSWSSLPGDPPTSVAVRLTSPGHCRPRRRRPRRRHPQSLEGTVTTCAASCPQRLRLPWNPVAACAGRCCPRRRPPWSPHRPNRPPGPGRHHPPRYPRRFCRTRLHLTGLVHLLRPDLRSLHRVRCRSRLNGRQPLRHLCPGCPPLGDVAVHHRLDHLGKDPSPMEPPVTSHRLRWPPHVSGRG